MLPGPRHSFHLVRVLRRPTMLESDISTRYHGQRRNCKYIILPENILVKFKIIPEKSYPFSILSLTFFSVSKTARIILQIEMSLNDII